MQWLYKIKTLADSSIDHYKAHWVAKGYTQQHGIDYNKTFTPVLKPNNLCLILAFTNANNYEIAPVDVDTAFLHALLDEETNISQPKGYINPQHPNHVCHLHKSLYGLKQAPMEWYKTIDSHLCANRFYLSEADPCLYVQQLKGLMAFIGLYVNNCTIITHCSQLNKIKAMIPNQRSW